MNWILFEPQKTKKYKFEKNIDKFSSVLDKKFKVIMKQHFFISIKSSINSKILNLLFQI